MFDESWPSVDSRNATHAANAGGTPGTSARLLSLTAVDTDIAGGGSGGLYGVWFETKSARSAWVLRCQMRQWGASPSTHRSRASRTMQSIERWQAGYGQWCCR